MLCHGHLPSYGDWGADRTSGSEPNLKLAAEAYRAALFFYQFSPHDDMRRKAKDTIGRLYPLLESQFGGVGIDLFFRHPEPTVSEPFSLPRESTVMGQAGIAILRDRTGATLLTRVGPNHTHAHDDVLAYNYYALGQEISADIGYGIYGTNAHYGWGSKAISHNTVVVNKDRQVGFRQLYKPFAGGEFSFLYESDEVSAIEGSAPELYGISAYRRMLATVPVGENASYVMDFFLIDGAETTDYAFHAFHEPSTLTIRGAAQVEASHWTLAGVDLDESERPSFDEPGLSFGERLTAGETFSSLLDGEEPRLWTPQLNNGYGYIYSVQEYRTNGGVAEAVWISERGVRFQWMGLLREDERLFTGVAPNLEGTHRYPVIVHRSQRPSMLYVAVACASESKAEACVRAVRELPVEGGGARAVRIELLGGLTDYWVYSGEAQELSVKVGDQAWVIQGRCAWLRFDTNGNICGTACISAEEMSFGEMVYKGRSRVSRKVLLTDVEGGKVECEPHAIGDSEVDQSQPRFVRLNDMGSSSWYPVGEGERAFDPGGEAVALRDSLILSKGIVTEIRGDVIVSRYPLPLGVAGTVDGASTFRGKRMIGRLGGEADIVRIPDLKELVVNLRSPFQIGEAFDIVDAAPGCELEWI
jgi:hypothetical protein